MPTRFALLLALACLGTSVAHAVQPLRVLGAGFEPGEPQRDCAVDATTEAGLAAIVRAPDGAGFCIPSFSTGLAQVCAGKPQQCAAPGCFVPLGPSSAVTVDAITGRITLADPLGEVVARIESSVLPGCTAQFRTGAATLALDYIGANDGLDGVVLGGLAALPDAQLVGITQVQGCPGYNSQMPDIIAQLRGLLLQNYVNATLVRIGEPLDAVICPIVRP